jgi:TPR repeat protein
MILKIHSKIILLIVVLIFAVNFFYDERKLFYLGCENHRRNSKKAYIYYLIATLKGSPRSENHLGFMYLDGKGVKKNRYKAFKYFKSAAEKGFGYAQIWVPLMPLVGEL